ncbi:hypothetical protein [Gracilibacillus orientalis]|uniref:hypothetical protein n=1 Tax=Gracilibacillus orientalis TaxID=334253 RepID=UPI0015879E7F|nr:hypothetical protein [Gracilibacillus orientalis]
MQLSLFDKEDNNIIGHVINAINDKYNSTAIVRASSYMKEDIAINRNEKIGGHYS